MNPDEPYSDRDDIIVISDEAHRTQAGKLARNMRLALPNAAFIGFTGTPLFKHDQLTKRIFGGYVSRYDFKRSEEDGATVKLVYENRGEKLGVARLDLNDRIADAIEKAELDPDQTALLEKLLGKDYEVITADERLDKIADDFVEHCAHALGVGQVHAGVHRQDHLRPDAQADRAAVEGEGCAVQAMPMARRPSLPQPLTMKPAALHGAARQLARAGGLAGRDHHRDHHQRGAERGRRLQEVGLRHHPAPRADEAGLRDAGRQAGGRGDGLQEPGAPVPRRDRLRDVADRLRRGVPVDALHRQADEGAHADAGHRAREPASIPGKDFGLIVDYNGMLKSLREALAQYALGDDGEGGEEIVAPIEERVQALLEAIEATEAHLRGLGFDADAAASARRASTRIKALRDAVEAVYTTDEAKRRFEILARQVFIRFKALLMEPSGLALRRAARQHRGDLQEADRAARHRRRDRAAARTAPHRQRGHSTQAPGEDQAKGLTLISRSTWKSCAMSSQRRSSARRPCFRTSARSSSRSWRRCWRAIRCAWTTRRSTRRSSPTTTGRRTGPPSRRPSPSWWTCRCLGRRATSRGGGRAN